MNKKKRSLTSTRIAVILANIKKPVSLDQLYMLWQKEYPQSPIKLTTLRQNAYALKREGILQTKSRTFFKVPDNIIVEDLYKNAPEHRQYIKEMEV